MHWLVVAAIAALLIWLAVLIVPRLFPLFWIPDFKRLLYEDFSLCDALSSFLAVVCAFICAAIWAPLMVWTLHNTFWKFDARKLRSSTRQLKKVIDMVERARGYSFC